jgi:hypothetical protein
VGCAQYNAAKCGLSMSIYILYIILKHGGPPADGDTPAGGGRADTPVGGGQAGAMLRMGMHACAMGERRMRSEPQRGGREDISARGGK